MNDKLLRNPNNKIIVSGQFKNLKKILGFVQKFAQKAGFSDAEIYKIQLAVDEAFTNIIEHAYLSENAGDIECSCESNDEEFIIQLLDYGKSFDPTTIETPNLNSNLNDRKTGWLGLYFIYQLMDEVYFSSISENDPSFSADFSGCPCNVLVMVKRRSKKI